MNAPEIRYAVTRDGVSLAYQVVGDGPSCLAILPGWLGNVDLMWGYPPLARLLTSLASSCQVILHDRRGTGLSDRVSPLPNLETRVEDLCTVLDAASAPRTILFGTETGGAVAALFAATYPERAAGLLWYAPRARTSRAADYPWGQSTDRQDVYLHLVGTDWGTEAWAAWLVADEAPRLAGDVELIEFLAQMSRHLVPPGSAVEMERMWLATDVRHVLGALRTPTLTIGREAWRAHDEERYVTSLIPGARYAILPTEDDFWFHGDTEPLVQTIRDFVGVPSPAPELDTVLSTVLFSDIVRSTELQVKLGDHGWKELVGRHHAIVRDCLVRWRGRENDTAGDGFYATFDGPARAIRCGLEIVERVHDLAIDVRVGLHTGECEAIDKKLTGITVAIGARVASHSAASEVLVTQTVKDLVAGSGLTFEDAGEHQLKGVPDPWHLYRVVA